MPSLAATCGASFPTVAAGLLFGADGIAAAGSRTRVAGDASPAAATSSTATTVPASIKDAKTVPSCPVTVLKVSRGAVLPCSMSLPPVLTKAGA